MIIRRASEGTPTPRTRDGQSFAYLSFIAVRTGLIRSQLTVDSPDEVARMNT
jgi:hypothetical protein